MKAVFAVILSCVTQISVGDVIFPTPLDLATFSSFTNKWLSLALFLEPKRVDSPPISGIRDRYKLKDNGLLTLEIKFTASTEDGADVCAEEQYTFFKISNSSAIFEGAAEGILMFFSNDTTNNMWVLRCMHWQKGDTGCPEENVDLFLNVKSNSASADLVEQQNYLTELGFSQDMFKIMETQAVNLGDDACGFSLLSKLKLE